MKKEAEGQAGIRQESRIKYRSTPSLTAATSSYLSGSQSLSPHGPWILTKRAQEAPTTTTIWQSNANGNFHVNLGRNKHKALIFLKVPAYFFLCWASPARPSWYQKSQPVWNGLVSYCVCLVVLPYIYLGWDFFFFWTPTPTLLAHWLTWSPLLFHTCLVELVGSGQDGADEWLVTQDTVVNRESKRICCRVPDTFCALHVDGLILGQARISWSAASGPSGPSAMDKKGCVPDVIYWEKKQVEIDTFVRSTREKRGGPGSFLILAARSYKELEGGSNVMHECMTDDGKRWDGHFLLIDASRFLAITKEKSKEEKKYPEMRQREKKKHWLHGWLITIIIIIYYRVCVYTYSPTGSDFLTFDSLDRYRLMD